MTLVWTLVIFSRSGRVVGLATYAERDGAYDAAEQINSAGQKKHVWAQVWESSILYKREEAA